MSFCTLIDLIKNIKFIRTGSRRNVLLVGEKALKFPKLNRWVTFISGVMENLEERYWWCSAGGYGWNDKYPMAKIFWADRFGFIVIQERLTVATDKEKFADEVNGDSELNTFLNGQLLKNDCKIDNFGYTKSGRLVKLDYGYFHGTMTCYLGAKAVEPKQFL